MPLGIVYTAILSVIDLLKISVIISIPVFVLVLAAIFLRKKIAERFKLSWVQGSFVSTYIIVLVLLFIVYVLPAASVFFGINTGQMPEGMQLTFAENVFIALYMIFKVLVNSLIFSLLLMPFALLGSAVIGKLEQKYKLHWAVNTFLGVFAAVLVATALVVVLFPWVPAGVLYLIYWG